MSIERVKELMKDVGWGYLATTDGTKVGVRPMGGLDWFGDELWCASGADTEKIAHLSKVPHAEYCFCANDGTHVRIGGPCTVSRDDDDKVKLYEAVPALKGHIPDPHAPGYVVIRMKPSRILMSLPPGVTYQEVKLL